jgi:hypothetical protein
MEINIMEKNKNIFETDLNSMLSTPIEVDAMIDNNAYPRELLTNRQTEDKDKQDESKEDESLIDLEDTKQTEEESEEDEDGNNEDTLEDEPSSDTEQSPQKSKSKTSSPLTPYAKLLVDEGVLPNLDVEKFDGTADSLKEAMVNEIMGAVDLYKESLPSRVKDLINNYEEGIPLEKLLELDRIETEVSNITEEKLEEDIPLQKKLVSDYLKRTTKFSETKISKLVDGYEDSGDLEDEAKSSYAELKTLAETEKANELKNITQQKKDAETQRKQDLIALQEKVKTTSEIIPGIKFNDKVKQNVLSSMTTPVGYDQAGRPVNKIVAARMDNPVEFEIKLHYLFEITKGFTDFSKLADKGKKDASKAFESAVSELDNSHKFDSSDAPEIKIGKKGEDFLKGLGKTYHI